jgi:hypothetical protein
MALAAESVNFGIVLNVISAKEACGMLGTTIRNSKLY